MRSIPQEEIVRWNRDGKDGLTFSMKHTTYLMTPEFKTKYFSELGVEIISEIERYGYSVELIKEFFSHPLLDEKGEIGGILAPRVIGTTTEKGKAVLFSMNALMRAQRSIAYYRKKSSDPQWLFSWKEKHNGRTLNTEPLYWPELLIHELSHVIVIEEKMADYVKFEEYEKIYMDEVLKLNNTNVQRYFVSKMTNLTHGRDFRRVYRSLCKEYGVKPESKYAEMKYDE